MKARDNPFATDRVHRIRYRLAEQEWTALERKLCDWSRRGALVGPEGSGKTTLLEDIAARLQRDGWTTKWLRLTRERPRFAPAELKRFFAELGRRDVILFDGAEQLGGWAWRRFLRRSLPAGGLLITSHRTGLLPTLHSCSTSPQLLFDIVIELHPPAPEVSAAQLRDLTDSLFISHRGNVRDALRALYDWSAERHRAIRA